MKLELKMLHLLHEIILIGALTLFFLQPASANLTAIQNDFESFRQISTVACMTTHIFVDCVCPKNDCVFCDYGEIIIQATSGAYCLKPKHEHYFSVMKKSHTLEKENRKSFLQLGRVGDLLGLCNAGKNCYLGNKTSNNSLQIKEVFVVLAKDRTTGHFIVLTTNVTTQCQEDYIKFTYDIKSKSPRWKISKYILQVLSLFFVLLEFFIYVSIKELRDNPYGKCVIW